jgi:HK97 family phage prohead protease
MRYMFRDADGRRTYTTMMLHTEAQRSALFVPGELEIREVNGRKVISGYASVFNQNSLPLKTASGGRFIERIAPGAFSGPLGSDREIVALVGHDHAKLLGRRSADTLQLRQDDKGLYVQITVPRTTVGRDALEDVRCGNIRGMSFGFGACADRWTVEGDDKVRIVSAIHDLAEVSLTPFPAYTGTSAQVASYDDDQDDDDDDQQQQEDDRDDFFPEGGRSIGADRIAAYATATGLSPDTVAGVIGRTIAAPASRRIGPLTDADLPKRRDVPDALRPYLDRLKGYGV